VTYVTQVADGFTLLPIGPKLNGRLSAKPGEYEGELLIRAEYLVAYAFDTTKPGDLTGPGDIVAFQRQDENYSLLKGRYNKEDLGLSSAASDGGMTYSMSCTAFNTGYLAPVYSEKTPPPPSGTGNFDEGMMYDLNKPLSDADGC
jgi:hypothetical protein